MTRSIVFVESNTTGTGRRLLELARDLGLTAHLLARDPSRYLIPDGVCVAVVETRDRAALKDACRDIAKNSSLLGISSTSEYFIEVASDLARCFGVPGVAPESIARTRDKESQREVLRQAGVPVPRYEVYTSGRADLSRTALKYPVVVKPHAGSGSVGVRLCRTPREARDHVEYLLARTDDERGAPIEHKALVEEYVSGLEFSVELLDGACAGVLRKHLGALPSFVEIGHDFPAQIPEPDRKRLELMASRAAHALGLEPGPAHVELKLDAGGRVWLIEVNPRLAGGMIPELIRLTTGEDLLLRLLEYVTARRFAMPAAAGPGFGCIRFITSNHRGRLLSVEGVDRASAVDCVADVRVYRSAGHRVEVHGDFRDRFGHVIAVASDADRARVASTLALGEIVVNLERQDEATLSARSAP